MSYLNVQNILPERLLKEIQEYVQGEYIYIPNKNGMRKKWGENSGYRAYLKDRNRRIKEKYDIGLSKEQIAQEFHLSIDSIKRIIYSK